MLVDGSGLDNAWISRKRAFGQCKAGEAAVCSAESTSAA
jgi:hypothetical protein